MFFTVSPPHGTLPAAMRAQQLNPNKPNFHGNLLEKAGANHYR